MFFISESSEKRKFKEIHNLNNNKASQYCDIPTKIIKSNSDVFSDFLYASINSYTYLYIVTTLRLFIRKGDLKR